MPRVDLRRAWAVVALALALRCAASGVSAEPAAAARAPLAAPAPPAALGPPPAGLPAGLPADPTFSDADLVVDYSSRWDGLLDAFG